MSILLYVVCASGVPFPDFCCLLSLLNAKRGQLNSYFWSAVIYDLMKGSFESKQGFGFFVERKIKHISVDVWIFLISTCLCPLYLLQRVNMGLDQHDGFFLVL